MATTLPGPIRRLGGRSILMLWATASLFAARADADRAIALTTSTAFLVQRNCVQSCIWNNGLNDVPRAISCPYPGSDACICRPDLIAPATDFLSSCVASACQGNTVDVTSAINLWTTYCAGDDAALFTYAPLASITDAPAFRAERGCVQSCIWANGYRDLNVALQCNYHWYDACLCRPDLVPLAESFLSSCVNSACSGNPGDIAGAISLSSAYCAAATNPTPTAAAGTATGSGSARPAGTVGSNPAATSKAGDSTTSALSNLATIVGSIAAAIAVALLVCCSACLVIRKRRREKELERINRALQWPAPAPAPAPTVLLPMQTWPQPSLVTLQAPSTAVSQVTTLGRSGSWENDEERDLVPSMQASPYSRRGMRSHEDEIDRASMISHLTRGSNPAQPGVGMA